jgi:glutathione S-transferase
MGARNYADVAMPARLYVIPASHPCAAVEAALRRKGVAYERVDLVPVAHLGVAVARFGHRTVPAIVFEDGEKVQGSRAILRALDDRVPRPPLLPVHSELRRQVLLAEEWGDEVLQPLARRVIWGALGRAPDAVASFSAGSSLPVPRRLQALSAPLVVRAERTINGAGDAAVRADLASLPGHLARVERWMAEGVLGGAEPNAADLQIGSSLALLATVEDLKLQERRAAELARRWFPDYPGRVPAGTLPAEWLAGSPRPTVAG